MNLSIKDKEFMEIALKEAKIAGKNGNFPIGAALVINGELIESGGNRLYENSDWHSHAENQLIHKHSKLIFKEIEKGSEVVLYTTLEPCFMCMGTALLHRIPRIVYACQDSYGGMTNIDKNRLPVFYKDRWPLIQEGIFAKESYALMIDFLKKNSNLIEFKEILDVYEKLNLRED